MSKHTLTLPKTPAKESANTVVKSADITAEQVMEWLKKNGVPQQLEQDNAPAVVVNAKGEVMSPTSIDWKYDAPVSSSPFDFSKLDPKARTVGVQPVPAAKVGNHRILQAQ